MARSLLPPSIQDDRFLTFEGLLRRLQAIDLALFEIYNPETVNSEVLPLLAAQFNVMGVKGWSLADTEIKKRQLIKNAIQLHRKAGTPYAIKLALATVGYPNVTITENPGLFYNGKWAYDGQEMYDGRQLGGFIVTLDPVQSDVSRGMVRLILALIDVWKNARSHLLDLRIGEISLFSNLLVYDGTWDYQGVEQYDGQKTINPP